MKIQLFLQHFLRTLIALKNAVILGFYKVELSLSLFSNRVIYKENPFRFIISNQNASQYSPIIGVIGYCESKAKQSYLPRV